MPRSPAGPERPGIVRRAVETLRRDGLRAFAFGVLGATVYRRLVIVERDLDGARAQNPLGLDVAFCGAERLDEYEELRPGERATAERRLAEGERWFGAWLDGGLVSARWVAAGAPLIDYLGLRLPLRADEVYVYDTFTRPELRGRGIAPVGLLLLFSLLAGEGWRRVLGSCLRENRAGWRSIMKSGYRDAGKMGCIRLGPWRHTFVHRR